MRETIRGDFYPFSDDDFDVWEETDDITGYIMIEINIDSND